MAGFLQALIHAMDGVAHVIRTQRNMRFHLLVGAAVTFIGFWLTISPVEWSIVIVAAGAVLAAETLNTVVESLVDLVSPAQHHLAKIAKDAAAGAVLLTAIAAALVGVVIFLPRLLARLAL